MKKELQQKKIIEALSVADTMSEAAEISGLSRQSLYNHLNADPDILEQFRDLKRRQFRQTADKLSAAALSAVDVLTEILSDENASNAERLRAAERLLTINGIYRNYEFLLNKDTFNELDAGELQIFNLDLKKRPSSL